jgi:hypothetical protein
MDDMPQIYSITEDLKDFLENKNELDIDTREEEGKIIDYDMSKPAISKIDLSSEYIKEDELKLFAEKVIIIRKHILDKVMIMEKEENEEIG